MSTNGYHSSALERVVDCLRRHGNQMPVKAMLNNCKGMGRAAFELELEKAGCPFRITFEYNGGPVPKEIVTLTNPGWSPPVVSQQEAARRLNSLSQDEWLNLLDPTRALRLKNKRGHRRTS